MNHHDGAEGQNRAIPGQLPQRGRGAIPYIGNAPNAAPNAQPQGQSGQDQFSAPIEVIPGQTRILLSEAASRHLDATGEECFRIASKAKHPDLVGRWVIHLAPCRISIARQAEGILLGTYRGVKLKSPTPSKS